MPMSVSRKFKRQIQRQRQKAAQQHMRQLRKKYFGESKPVAVPDRDYPLSVWPT